MTTNKKKKEKFPHLYFRIKKISPVTKHKLLYVREYTSKDAFEREGKASNPMSMSPLHHTCSMFEIGDLDVEYFLGIERNYGAKQAIKLFKACILTLAQSDESIIAFIYNCNEESFAPFLKATGFKKVWTYGGAEGFVYTYVKEISVEEQDNIIDEFGNPEDNDDF